MKKKKELTITEAAELMHLNVDDCTNYTRGLPIQFAVKLFKKDRIKALAAYLKWDMSSMSCVNDEEWIETAEDCAKLLGVK